MVEAVSCLSVVMPSYNEAATVETVIGRVLASPYVAGAHRRRRRLRPTAPSRSSRASTTRGSACSSSRSTWARARRCGGASQEATAPYVIVQDADLEYDPAEYATVLGAAARRATPTSSTAPASSPAARTGSSTTGTRSATGSSPPCRTCSPTSTSPTWRPATRRSAVRSSSRSRSRRTASGSSRRSPPRSPAAGWRIYEVGISYSGRTYAEGKKIGWRDGVRAIYCVVRYSRRVAARARSTRPRAGPQHPAGGVRRLRRRARPTSCARSRKPTTTPTGSTGSIAPAPRRATCSRSAPGTASSPSGCAADARSPRPTSRSAASTSSRTRFAGSDEVEVPHADVAALGADDRKFDSVVLVNVLEHIDDDVGALADLRELLEPGGRLCVFVPAFDGLYSDFDRRIGHRRRYRRSQLVTAVRPRRARRRRRPLRQHGRRGRLVVVRPPARPGAHPALVGEALRPARRCRRSAGSRTARHRASASRCSASAPAPSTATRGRRRRRRSDLERLVLDLLIERADALGRRRAACGAGGDRHHDVLARCAPARKPSSTCIRGRSPATARVTATNATTPTQPGERRRAWPLSARGPGRRSGR